MSYFKKYYAQLALAAILIVASIFLILAASSDSLTNDEKIHISAGYLHVFRGDYRFNVEHPPLLNDIAGFFVDIARPKFLLELDSYPSGADQWRFADDFFYAKTNNLDQMVFWARLPFIFLTLGLIYLIYLWAKALFGQRAGLLAATLAAFSPNILAHGHLATTDIGLTFFFLLTLWLLRKYYSKPDWLNAVLFGFGLGLVLSAKFSAIVIVPIIFFGVVFAFWKYKRWQMAIQFLVALITALAVIWVIYVFSMRSDLVSSNFWQWFYLPYEKYLLGLNSVFAHNLTGHPAYLNGKLSSQGWWYYFPLVLWYKMTLAELLLLGMAIILIFRLPKKIALFDYFLIIFPPLLFLGVSMVGHLDIGIRHILIFFPFVYIFVSHLVLNKNLVIKYVVFALALSQFAIAIFAYPNYLSYFNQIAGGIEGGRKHLADSNVDWDQDIKRLKTYIERNNLGQIKIYQCLWDGRSLDYYGIKYQDLPKEPVKGVVVISDQWLKVPRPNFDPSWVAKYPPDEIVGTTLYVWRFDLKPVEMR